jgi:hypothetical protein
MSQNLSMFMNDYRDHTFAVDFTRHDNGITIRYQVDELGWRSDSDSSWSSYENAKQAGIDICKSIIDSMVG